jgi:hypothetical protein
MDLIPITTRKKNSTSKMVYIGKRKNSKIEVTTKVSLIQTANTIYQMDMND